MKRVGTANKDGIDLRAVQQLAVIVEQAILRHPVALRKTFQMARPGVRPGHDTRTLPGLMGMRCNPSPTTNADDTDTEF